MSVLCTSGLKAQCVRRSDVCPSDAVACGDAVGVCAAWDAERIPAQRRMRAGQWGRGPLGSRRKGVGGVGEHKGAAAVHLGAQQCSLSLRRDDLKWKTHSDMATSVDSLPPLYQLQRCGTTGHHPLRPLQVPRPSVFVSRSTFLMITYFS